MPNPDPDRDLPDPGDETPETCRIHRVDLDRYGCPGCEAERDRECQDEQDAYEMRLPL